MEALGGIAIMLGLILILVGAITFIIAAFQESILWGIGVLVFPVLQLVFLIVNWQRAKGPFILQLYGIGLILLSVFVLHHRFPLIHGHLDF